MSLKHTLKLTKKNSLNLLKLLRLRNCVISFFAVIVGAAFTYSGEGIFITPDVIAGGFAVFLITGAGNIVNDYFDYEIDKVNQPEKPLPAGKISRSDALMVSILLFLIGIGLGKTINDYTLTLATFNTVVLIGYAAYSKKMLFISNVIVSYLVASVFFFGALINIDVLSQANQDGLIVLTILAACAFLMTMAREILKDIEDVEGDKYAYSKTLPIEIGHNSAKQISTFFTFAAVLISLIPFLLTFESFSLGIYTILIVSADLIFLGSVKLPEDLAQKTIILGMVVALIAFLTSSLLPKLLLG